MLFASLSPNLLVNILCKKAAGSHAEIILTETFKIKIVNKSQSENEFSKWKKKKNRSSLTRKF